MPAALRRAGTAADGAVGGCFAAAAAALASGAGAVAAWETLLARLHAETALLPADIAALAPLGPQLGLTEAADQARHLQLAGTGLERQLAKAEAEAARLGKLYRYAGPLAGSAAVVLLF